jgi:hypothetical protein
MKANHHTLSFLLALLVLLSPVSVASASGRSSKKSLENSKSVKYKSKTEVNFDEATIEGSVRTPYGQSLNSRDQNFNRNFIKYRKHFHDQMLLSTGGLSP